MFGQNKEYKDFFKEVFEKYSQFIFSHIIHKVGKRNDALDIAQNVFVHLWKYRKELKNKNPEAIIFKACRQEIYQFYKNQTGIIEIPIDTLNIQIADHSEEEREQQIENERLLASIYDTLELVPVRRKQIFLLSKIEGKTREQIATEMNMSKSAIGNQIDKTMRFLIGMLRK